MKSFKFFEDPFLLFDISISMANLLKDAFVWGKYFKVNLSRVDEG